MEKVDLPQCLPLQEEAAFGRLQAVLLGKRKKTVEAEIKRKLGPFSFGTDLNLKKFKCIKSEGEKSDSMLCFSLNL